MRLTRWIGAAFILIVAVYSAGFGLGLFELQARTIMPLALLVVSFAAYMAFPYFEHKKATMGQIDASPEQQTPEGIHSEAVSAIGECNGMQYNEAVQERHNEDPEAPDDTAARLEETKGGDRPDAPSSEAEDGMSPASQGSVARAASSDADGMPSAAVPGGEPNALDTEAPLGLFAYAIPTIEEKVGNMLQNMLRALDKATAEEMARDPVFAQQVLRRQESVERHDRDRDGDTKEAQEDTPWLRIPDHNWDREVLRLWHEGLTCPEIEGKTAVASAARIRNRLSELRKEFGEDLVPTDDERKKVTRRKGKIGHV